MTRAKLITAAARALRPLAAALLLLLIILALEVIGQGGLGPQALLTFLGGLVLVELALGGALLVVVLAWRGLRRLTDARAIRSAALPALLLALLAAALLVPVGGALASGPWISQQSWAALVRVGPAVGGGLGVFALAWILLAFPARDEPSRLRRRLLCAGALVGAIAAAAADIRVLPNLYPEFHRVAFAAAAVFAWIAADRLLEARVVRARAGRLALLAAPLTAAAALAWLSMGPDVRAQLLLRSSTAANLVRSASPGLPKTYLRDALRDLDVDADPLLDAVDLPRGLLTIGDDWNVILITVDTLRADVLPPARLRDRAFVEAGDTPFLDRWIASNYRFTAAYAQAPVTRRSMPAMFRSLEVFEDPATHGIELATYMAAQGRAPVAMVNNFFLEPRFAASQALLDGFARTSIYEKAEMREQVPRTRALLEEVRDGPFFAWIHLYCMHAPGYDGRMLSADDGPWPARYRASLRWLDGEMERLIAALEALGVAERTVIIFTSDHGEGLGDHRTQNHGPTVFDSEVKIPLVIAVPGQEGRLIDATVGNIDILPTITDMLGLPVEPSHRGQSLVPLLVGDGDVAWERDYYVENARSTSAALVHAGEKLIYDVAGDSFFRFDLREDPDEQRSLYLGEGRDRELLDRLVRRNPRLFRDELRDPEVAALVRERLDEVDAAAPGGALPFLLGLLAVDAGAGVDEALRIFADAEDDRVRLLVLRELFDAAPPLWSEPITARIQEVLSQPEELAFVRGLALQGQPVFNRPLAAERVKYWSRRGEPDTWGPWLRLVKPWSHKSLAGYGSALGAMLRKLRASPEAAPQTLTLVLETVASLGSNGTLRGRAKRGTKQARALVAAVAPFLEAEAPAIRAAACAALGAIDDGASTPALRGLLEAPAQDVRVKQAALHAFARVDPIAAVPLIAEHGEDPLLTVDAIKLLSELRAPAGLPFLERIEAEHYNALIRKRARRAIDAIEAVAPIRPEADPG
ncbi:MAG: sulfatase [Nannocystaceae bacterium]